LVKYSFDQIILNFVTLDVEGVLDIEVG
jgi:hypothetical protein